MGHLLQSIFAACDCSLPRILRSGCCCHQEHAEDPGVPKCHGSEDGHLVFLAMAGQASSRLVVGGCKVPGDQQPIVLVVAQASRRILWDTLCLGTSFVHQKRRLRCQLCSDCRGLLRHTLTFSNGSGRKLCTLAFGCCLEPPLSLTCVVTCGLVMWRRLVTEGGSRQKLLVYMSVCMCVRVWKADGV